MPFQSKMGLVKYEQLYQESKFEECRNELNNVIQEISVGRDVPRLIASAQLDEIALSLDSHIILAMLEGNVSVVNDLMSITSATSKEILLDSNFSYCAKLEVLVNCRTVPLYFYLTGVYNSLWKIWLLPQKENYDRNELFCVLMDCFRMVLLSCGVQAKKSSTDHDSELLHQLLFQVVRSLPYLESLECSQVVEIILLCLHLFLDFNWLNTEKIVKSVLFLKDSWLQIQNKCFVTQVKTLETKFVFKLFKFGFFQLNEMLDFNSHQVWQNLSTLLCLLLYRIGYAKDSLLLSFDESGGTGSNFLWHYIQAYISLSAEKLDLCLLYLNALSRFPMSNMDKAYFFMLKGYYYETLGSIKNSHDSFMQVLLCGKMLFCSALASILKNIINHVHINIKKNGILTESLIINKLIQAMTCIYNILLKADITADEEECCIKRKILKILHRERCQKPNDILHVISKELLWMKVNNFAPNCKELSNLVSDCYMDLLYEIYVHQPSKFVLDQSPILHETIVALMMGNKISQATTICYTMIEEKGFVKGNLLKCKGKDAGLYLMENGVTAKLLLAYMKMYQNLYEEAQEILRQVKRILLQNYFLIEETDENKVQLLLDNVLAKICVLDAVILLKKGFNSDALKNCERALIHSSDPQIVQDCSEISQKLGAEMKVPKNNATYSMKNCDCLVLNFLFAAKLPL